jgi:hypothetical protein
MTFSDILKSDVTNLPIVQAEIVSFRETLRDKLYAFLALINEVDNNRDQNIFPISILEFKTNVKSLIDGILSTVDIYYTGKPSLAYEKLSTTLRDSTAGSVLEKSGVVSEGSFFFRIRRKNGSIPLTKKEMFHIPFEMRGCVKSQRYSIPGLPSLYVSNCIYVAWEEMGRPDFNELQAVKLQTNQYLRFLDLTTDHYSSDDAQEISEFELMVKLLTWPLIGACSVKVKETTDTFKPEYIIPQLLLQWINTTNLHGIKYSSTHIDMNTKRHEGSFYNLVLPVRTFDLETGYCPELLEMFHITQCLPMQLRQYASINDRWGDQDSISSYVNKEITSIEIVNGKVQLYSQTAFGVLEHALGGLKFESIEDRLT